ncbi:hypothetical protein KVF89_20110 [Nocardioides carbamazepini]|uniref:hypothetical protein n=1 Tax=Nocardioides carbamazepini TaxID=2854259 RepID=UPI00214A81DF|nr:hypothetical protein [Nocardioides carbamazepini]MCR1784858.1 hypothetical protein [Nocardioides carbamazepini]
MRWARVAVGVGLVVLSALYAVGWFRARHHLAYLWSADSTTEELLWLGTSLAVGVAGVLVLVGTIGLLRGQELRGWTAWATTAALCVAGVLPAVRVATVTRSESTFLPDPFREHGPEWALYLPHDDPWFWRSAVWPFTLLAMAWTIPLLVRQLNRVRPRRLPLAVVAVVGAITVLLGACLHGTLVVASLASFS